MILRARRANSRSTWRNGPSRYLSSLWREETNGTRVARRGDRAVDVPVHEMGVEQVGIASANGPDHPGGHARIQVRRAPDVLERHSHRAELTVEAGCVGTGDVEAEESGVDAPLAQRGQQRQKMTFRAADPGDLVDVQDSHGSARSLR